MMPMQANEKTALLDDANDQDDQSPEMDPEHGQATPHSASAMAWRLTRTLLILAGCGLAIAGIVFLVQFGASDVARDSAPSAAAPDGDVFDAIIVGGGPAGSVIAKLLSDDRSRRVLLIEAGNASQADLGGEAKIDGNRSDMTVFDVPFYWTNVANTPDLHWDYPDVHVAKALGGCGIHNAMLYVRALPSDLEKWNLPRWTWEKALELYLAMEEFQGPPSSYHGSNGVIRTMPPPPPQPLELAQQFVDVCEDVGIPKSSDFNSPYGRFGAGFYHFNIRDGVRDSAARTFLGPVLRQGRENFQLLLHTQVTKVHLDEGRSATGVEVEDLVTKVRRTIRLSQKGQVILTAGAINTPKILMLSGIGDAAILSPLNIQVKKHLPRVGKNLQDHPSIGVAFEDLSPTSMNLEAELVKFFGARKNASNTSSFGILGTTGISAGAFLIPPGSTVPEVQLTLFPSQSEPHITKSDSLDHNDGVLFTVTILHPEARNTLFLSAKDGNVPANESIDANNAIPDIVGEVPMYGSEEYLSGTDVWKLSWGVSIVREIAAKLQEKYFIGKELSPGAEYMTEQDLNKWVYEATFRNSHWVGSASMATSEEEGVVDNHLRVFGVHKLRVADASVIPLIPNGNVHSTVLMVAAHAAELIVEDEMGQASDAQQPNNNARV